MNGAAVRPLILVLEDEAVVAMELEARLGSLGYRVAGPVSTVEAALALAERERPDLLLADIRLQGQSDGIAAAAALRTQLGVPAVYLSAHADAATLARAIATDPFGYLTKPLRESELHATIITALHRDRLERKLAERELQLEEAQRLGRLGSWEWDLAQDRVTWSRPLLELVGVDAGALPQGFLAVLLTNVHEADRDAVRASIDRALASDQPVEFLCRLAIKDGPLRWIETRAGVDRDASRRPVRMRGISRDVTEARAAACAIESSEARFRAVFEGAMDALLVIDPRGKIGFANGAADALFGYARGELVGLQVETLVPLALRAGHAGRRADFAVMPAPRIMAAGRNVLGLTRDGVEVPLEISLRQAPFEGETCVVVAARDVTARLLKEAEIRRLAAMVEHASECISLSTPDGKLVFLNQAGTRMLGIEPDQVQQHTLDEVIPPDLVDKLRQEVIPPLLAGQSWEGELKCLNIVTGALTEVYCWSFAINEPATSTASYLACVFLDITDKKRAERELAQRRERMAQTERLEAIGRLASGVAHDFNNLLTVILGMSRLLEPMLVEQPRALSLVGDICEASRRGADLVSRLLMFARRTSVRASAVDVNAEIESFARLLTHILGPKIELVPELSAAGCHVWLDPSHMEQLLLNLAVNARDAMPDGGRLWLRTRSVPREGDEANEWVVIEVEDEGCGMSEEVRSHIFEPFFTTKEFGRGTGLGLSIVYGLVTQAGGEVAVQSAPGEGATFAIRLPIHAEVGSWRAEDVDEPSPESAGGQLDAPPIGRIVDDGEAR